MAHNVLICYSDLSLGFHISVCLSEQEFLFLIVEGSSLQKTESGISNK